MGWRRQNRRKHWHMTGYICPKCTKPKSIKMTPELTERFAQMARDNDERREREEAEWYYANFHKTFGDGTL